MMTIEKGIEGQIWTGLWGKNYNTEIIAFRKKMLGRENKIPF